MAERLLSSLKSLSKACQTVYSDATFCQEYHKGLSNELLKIKSNSDDLTNLAKQSSRLKPEVKICVKLSIDSMKTQAKYIKKKFSKQTMSFNCMKRQN